jgi:hypothetical protein
MPIMAAIQPRSVVVTSYTAALLYIVHALECADPRSKAYYRTSI